tara:strand:+ start:850 stop:1449 length:600 start_codon:yes stop_codon:yes gene_type:complete
MKYLDLFPTVVLSEELNNISFNEIEQYKTYLTTLPFNNNEGQGKYTVTQQLLENPIFNSLKESILNISKNYCDELDHMYLDLQIASSWATLHKKDINTNFHKHANSYLSGVFYLTEGSNIKFSNPLNPEWCFEPNKNPDTNNYRSFEEYSFSPFPRFCLIFPSFLKHSIEKSISDDRTSIAFNIIPKGEFGRDTRKIYI